MEHMKVFLSPFIHSTGNIVAHIDGNELRGAFWIQEEAGRGVLGSVREWCLADLERCTSRQTRLWTSWLPSKGFDYRPIPRISRTSRICLVTVSLSISYATTDCIERRRSCGFVLLTLTEGVDCNGVLPLRFYRLLYAKRKPVDGEWNPRDSELLPAGFGLSS